MNCIGMACPGDAGRLSGAGSRVGQTPTVRAGELLVDPSMQSVNAKQSSLCGLNCLLMRR
jgi:hypothetical protein